MEQRVTALYFSPTHGTRAYVRAVAAAIPGEHREVDLTRPEERRKEYHFTENDLVILGVPVYYGRVPEVEGLLDGLHGGNTPVILLAVYGNRLIDDALVELSDLCAARGFRTLAAGSFVAPHTFSARVGQGRPNGADLAAAAELADAADVAAWARPAVEFCLRTGTLTADGSGRFLPGDTITREEAAEALEAFALYVEANQAR